jgi:hypothetical protein
MEGLIVRRLAVGSIAWLGLVDPPLIRSIQFAFRQRGDLLLRNGKKAVQMESSNANPRTVWLFSADIADLRRRVRGLDGSGVAIGQIIVGIAASQPLVNSIGIRRFLEVP